MFDIKEYYNNFRHGEIDNEILEIDDVILHPKYDLSNAYQDISVIKLKPNKGK